VAKSAYGDSRKKEQMLLSYFFKGFSEKPIFIIFLFREDKFELISVTAMVGLTRKKK
jgi:hypothetical protein